MKMLIRKLLFFSLPFLLWVSVVVLCDPYNYFNVSHLISDKIKLGPSFRLNCRLWKIVKFRRSPCENIILGDSRADRIDVNLIKAATGTDFFNFALYAASVPEIVDTFNYANNLKPLKNVYIGLNFNLYNSNYCDNIFSRVELFSRDYKNYLFDRTVAKALVYDIISFFNKTYFKIGRPTADKDTFWKYNLSYGAGCFYAKYDYPAKYYQDLKQISDYCKLHHINLVFFMPPTHTDLQKRVADYGLVAAENRFMADISKLGTVYDFDYPNEWTQKREYFDDPFHFTPCVMEKIVDEIWGGNHRVARIIGKSAIEKSAIEKSAIEKSAPTVPAGFHRNASQPTPSQSAVSQR